MSSRIIAFFGDSNTRGTFFSVDESHRWTYLVCQSRNAIELNCGVGGDNTTLGLARLQADVIAHAPEWCTVMFGTNDAFYTVPPGISVAQFAANLAEIVSRLRAASIKPVLMTPAFARDVQLEALIGPYLQSVRALAYAQSVPLVDWHARTAEMYALDPAAYTALFVEPADPRLHLNAAGQAQLAAMFNLPQHADLLVVPPPVSNPPSETTVKVYARINQLNGAYNLDSVGLTNATSVSRTALGRARVTYATPLDAPICPVLTGGEPGHYVIFPVAWTNTYVDVGIRVSNYGADADASFVVMVP